MRTKSGFSLLEVSVVIFVMGITITALLQMFELGHMRYNAISSGLKARSLMAEIRVWLRERIMQARTEELTTENLEKQVNFVGNFRCSELKVSNYDQDTFFVQLKIFEDRNKNGKVEASETSEQKLFCFRRRSS